MAESGDAERHFSQVLLAGLSVAMSVGMQVQQRRAAEARRALQESEQRQKELAAQLAAEREMAAVQWRKVDDIEWVRSRPDEVAQAWASARIWEPVDPRAAEARARFEAVFGALYNEPHPPADLARETEDYAALATLLQRALEPSEDAGKTVYYESVPEEERHAWLERQVWGPTSETDPAESIARSRQLEDLENGLPITVLREMTSETREAWISLERMSPQERHAWRRQWLESQVWGKADLTQTQRDARARELDRVLSESPATVRPFTPEEWQGWVAETRERLNRASTEAAAASGPEQERPAVVEGGVVDVETVREASEPSRDPAEPATPRESDAERLERTRGVVREAWPEDVADAVIERPAFGAFAHRLHQLEERGYGMKDILGQMEPHGLVGLDRYGKPIRDSAAFAEYLVKQLAKSLPPKAEADAGIERLEKYVADQDASAEATPEKKASTSAPQEAGRSAAAAPQAAPDKYEDAVNAIGAVWSHDADWIVASQSRSVDRLADALAQARQRGLDPTEFMRDAVRASGVERLTQPNKAIGEADPVLTTTYEAGIPHPGALGTDPAGFAARQVRKRLAELETTAPPSAPESRGAEQTVTPSAPSSGPSQTTDAERARVEPERQVRSGPASPWSRAGSENRGLGAGAQRAADAELRDAAEDHERAEQRRDEAAQQRDDGAPESLAESQALDAEAQRLNNAAGEHENAAEDLRRGAYDTGAEPVQLARQSYPQQVSETLKNPPKRGKKQGKQAPQARRWRGPHEERGR